MRIAWIVLFLGSIAYTNCASFETDMTYVRMCNYTSPISLRTMNEVLINKHLSRSTETEAFTCFLHCLFAKYGWMDEEGGFELHRMKAALDEAHVEVDSLEFILYKCTAVDSIDKCERAFLFLQCFWETMEQLERHKDDELFYSMDEAYKKLLGGKDIIF